MKIDKNLLEKMTNYFSYNGELTVNNTGLVSISGSCEFINTHNITTLPVNFEKIYGNFNCDSGNLTSLIGGPSIVGGSFDCSYNKLTSLEGAPIQVGGNFRCNNNNLTSLTGIPKTINGNISVTLGKNTPSLKLLTVNNVNLFEIYNDRGYYLTDLSDLFHDLYHEIPNVTKRVMTVYLEMIKLGYGLNARL